MSNDKNNIVDSFLDKLNQKNIPDDKIDEIIASAREAGLDAASLIKLEMAASTKKGNKEIEYNLPTPSKEYVDEKRKDVSNKVEFDKYGRIRNPNYRKEQDNISKNPDIPVKDFPVKMNNKNKSR